MRGGGALLIQKIKVPEDLLTSYHPFRSADAEVASRVATFLGPDIKSGLPGSIPGRVGDIKWLPG